MSWDRSEVMNRRSGLLGWFDKVRYKEIYRQALGLILVAVCAAFAVTGHWNIIIGLLIALAGQLFRIFAAGTIFKNKELASDGAYSLVRHPLYLGNILILGGFSLASGNLWVALAVLLYVDKKHLPGLADAVGPVFPQYWADGLFEVQVAWLPAAFALSVQAILLVALGYLPFSRRDL